MIKAGIIKINFMDERVTSLSLILIHTLTHTHTHTHTLKCISRDKLLLLRIFHKDRNPESPDSSKIILRFFFFFFFY